MVENENSFFWGKLILSGLLAEASAHSLSIKVAPRNGKGFLISKIQSAPFTVISPSGKLWLLKILSPSFKEPSDEIEVFLRRLSTLYSGL